MSVSFSINTYPGDRTIVSSTWNRSESFINSCMCHSFFHLSFLYWAQCSCLLPKSSRNIVRNKDLFRVGSNFRLQVQSKIYVFVTFLNCLIRGSDLEEMQSEIKNNFGSGFMLWDYYLSLWTWTICSNCEWFLSSSSCYCCMKNMHKHMFYHWALQDMLAFFTEIL